MFFPTGPPVSHAQSTALLQGECVQSVATNANGSVIAVLSQVQLHLWSGAREVVHLTSIALPRASLEEDAGQYLLWHPHRANCLAVIMARRVLFYEIDIGLKSATFLRPVAGVRNNDRLHYCDASSRVGFSAEVPIEVGLVACVSSGGSNALVVGTTAGLVCIIGWMQQRLLHSWTVTNLCVPQRPAEGSRAFRKVEEQGGTGRDGAAHLEPSTPLASTSRSGCGSGPVVPPGVVRQSQQQRVARDPLHHHQQEEQQKGAISLSATSLTTSTSPLKGGSAGAAPVMAPTSPLSVTSVLQHIGDERVAASAATGAILHVTFAPRLQLFSFVLSSGYVLLATTSKGTELTQADVSFTGRFTPVVFASSTCVNVSHRVVAVSTQSGGLSCRPFNPQNLSLGAPLWTNLRCLEEVRARLGAVSCMQWSPREEDLLCVGFYKGGIALLHYSGACLMTSLARSGLPREVPVARAWQPFAGLAGCVACCWHPSGTRLLAVEPQSSGFVSFRFARVLASSEVGPDAGNNSPLVLLGPDALHLAGASGRSGLGVEETVAAPEAYLAATYPLRHGAISADGSRIVCAGGSGCAVYDRDTREWHLLKASEDNRTWVCVCDPAWLATAAVVLPVFHTGSKTFELAVFAHSNLSSSAVLARTVLAARPTMTSVSLQDACGGGFIAVLDVRQELLLIRFDILVDSHVPYRRIGVVLTCARTLNLTGTPLAYPLRVLPMCQGGISEDVDGGGVGTESAVLDVPHLLVHRRDDHALVWVPASVVRSLPVAAVAADPVNETAAAAAVVACAVELHFSNDGAAAAAGGVSTTSAAVVPRVFGCWRDRTAPLPGLTLLVHEEGGLFLYHGEWPSALQRQGSAQQRDECQNHQQQQQRPEVVMRRLRVSVVRDVELVPLCVSPCDSAVLCATEAYERGGESTLSSLQASYYRSQGHLLSLSAPPPPPPVGLVLRPVLYAHRVLAALLQRSGPHASFVWNRKLFYWLEQMRVSNTFVATLDYFLYTIVNEQPPAGATGLDRRSAIMSTLSLLRRYPEFYEVIVGCVRKMDVSRWHTLLDFIGPPLDFYHECIANNRLSEAVHLVRVIMMGSYNVPPLREGAAAAASIRGSFGSSTGTDRRNVSPQQQQQQARALGVAEGSVVTESTSDSTGSGEALASAQTIDSLLQACACAIQLFELVLRSGEYTSAYDLLRFMALLRHEVGMPDAAEAIESAGGMALLGRWLRKLRGGDDDAGAIAKAESGRGVPHFPSLCFMPGTDRASTTAVASTASTMAADSSKADASEPAKGSPQPLESAMLQMFAAYPELPRMIVAEASHLVETGRLLHLCRLMATFSLSLPHFVSSVSSRGGAGLKVPREESVTVMMDGLHCEFGLPRSNHAIGVAAAAALSARTHPCDEDMDGGEEAKLLAAASKELWSSAQCTLYGTPGLLSAVLTVKELYAPLLLQYAVLLNVLLMSKVDVIRALSPINEGTERGTARDTAEVIAWMSALETWASTPAYSGYKCFVQDVIESLPPNLLHVTVLRRSVVQHSSLHTEGGEEVGVE